MNATQRFAVFNLMVIGLALFVLAILFPVMGKGALGAFGVLGLMGFGPFFFRSRGVAGQVPVVVDERDRKIQLRAWFFAHLLFWLVFVLAAVPLAGLVYGQDGAVPVEVIQASVFAGLIVVYGAASLSMLWQYGWAARHGE